MQGQRKFLHAREMRVSAICVLAFAEHLLLKVPRMWAAASLDQKQRLQQMLFPTGVTYGAEGFGTAEVSLVFEMLDAFAAGDSSAASPTGFEPGRSLRNQSFSVE